MPEVLDLDALVPAKVNIKFDNQTIEVKSPSLEQFAKMMQFSQMIEKAQGDNSPEELVKVFEQVKQFIYTFIPELTGKDLNPSQITAIFKLLADMGSPSDEMQSKLEQQGIEVKTADPKALA